MELSIDEPDAPSKSIRYLIAAAFAWEFLALLPILLLFRTEYGMGRAVPLVGRGLLVEIVKFVGYATVLLGDYVQGRIVGHGSLRTGLCFLPISRRPIVILMAVLIAGYAVLWDLIHYLYFRDAVYQQFLVYAANPWAAVDLAFGSVLLGSVSEELLFRGWLWTGLRNHWGALPTAAVTGAFWLGIHSANIILWLLPAAVMLSIARHFGQSVRASIALHMLYNFIVLISPIALNAAGFF